MKRFLRYLRVAWSVGCAIACVLLIVLWVLSFTERDYLQGQLPGGMDYTIASAHGLIFAAIFERDDETSYGFLRSDPSDDVQVAFDKKDFPFGVGIRTFRGHQVQVRQIIICHLFVICSFAGLAAAPWLRWRFSLRTLLIATTLVAMVLGLIVWAMR